jgi:hypothetical protein
MGDDPMTPTEDTAFDRFLAAGIADDALGYPNGAQFIPADQEWADDAAWRALRRRHARRPPPARPYARTGARLTDRSGSGAGAIAPITLRQARDADLVALGSTRDRIDAEREIERARRHVRCTYDRCAGLSARRPRRPSAVCPR